MIHRATPCLSRPSADRRTRGGFVDGLIAHQEHHANSQAQVDGEADTNLPISDQQHGHKTEQGYERCCGLHREAGYEVTECGDITVDSADQFAGACRTMEGQV